MGPIGEIAKISLCRNIATNLINVTVGKDCKIRARHEPFHVDAGPPRDFSFTLNNILTPSEYMASDIGNLLPLIRSIFGAGKEPGILFYNMINLNSPTNPHYSL